MRNENVEIYSDATNAVVLRHPARRFPGVLVQGDTLHLLCQLADESRDAARGKLNDDANSALDELRDRLWDLLRHYKLVLGEHGIPVPFFEGPDA